MSEIRKRMELWFESFGHLVFRHRWIALLLILLPVIGLGSQLPKLTIDTSTESFLHKDDHTILIYNEFRRQFGRDEFIIIAIESSNIFSSGFLEKLNAFHKELEDNLPYMEDITSLINARNARFMTSSSSCTAASVSSAPLPARIVHRAWILGSSNPSRGPSCCT